MEEYVYVLDYLPNGPVGARGPRVEPLVYAVGESEFRLFELVAKPKADIQFEQRLYIGQDAAKRAEIDHVKRRIKYDDLTATAQGELEYAVTSIVMSDEQKFLAFYNNARMITLKKHALEELPGLGKKTMQAIVDERKKGNFTSFDDLAERVPLKQPQLYIVKRIIDEMAIPEHRHYIFVPKDAPRRAGDRPQGGRRPYNGGGDSDRPPRRGGQ